MVHSGVLKVSQTYLIGVTMVCIGTLCNEWVLKALWSSDGVLAPETRAQIWFFEVVLILSGLLLIRFSRWTSAADALRYWVKNYPKAMALAVGLALMSAIFGSTETFFYFLNRAKTTNDVREFTEGKLNQRDPALGYKPLPNRQVVSKMRLRGREIFNVTYSTDAYGRRVTPVRRDKQTDRFLLFFGCSFTFGLGVEDYQTLPSVFGEMAPRFRPYNYGVDGYSPQQMLVKLQQPSLKREIQEKEGLLVYTFIPDHVYRVKGAQHVAQGWGKYLPYYRLDSAGNLERRGNFMTGRPGLALLYWLLSKSEIARYFQIGFGERISDNDLNLTARIFSESHKAFSKLFGNQEFVVLIYPENQGKRFIPIFQRAKVRYLDYSELFDPQREDLHIEGDPHPTPKALRLVAEQLSRDLGIRGAAK